MLEYGISWETLIGDLGFPIVVTAYLLIRFEKKLESLTLVIQDLKDAIKPQEGK